MATWLHSHSHFWESPNLASLYKALVGALHGLCSMTRVL